MGPFRDGWTKKDVEEVIERGDPAELLYVPIVVSMDPPNPLWSHEICLALAEHDNWSVRGNAILGFGHLSRTTGQVNEARVFRLVADALTDENDYVRGQAHCAADDLNQYLGWDFSAVG